MKTQIFSILDCTTAVTQTVTIFGWVDTKRDHGKLTFIDLRDRTGKVQCVGYQKMGEVTTESVLKIVGEVKQRPDKMVNSELPTGTIEIDVHEYEVLNSAKELPLPIDNDGYAISEEIRLQYRYLDLRRQRMQKNLRLRSEYGQIWRNILHENRFIEVETPMLTKSTKEGSRDFIVPSRFQPGKFYALPQSPQQYKQLLMTAGIERYFQFARCIRDEDLRADRGFEHTQIDLEISFMDQAGLMNLIESMVKQAVTQVGGKLRDQQFPVFSYRDAIDQFGKDKFDLRSESEKTDGTLAFAWVVDFPFFKKVDSNDPAEVADGKSGWTFTHNPFSMPKPEYLEQHLKNESIAEIVTTQYDLVCNGYEVGGGSIRAHRPEIVRATFATMGYSEVEIEASIGHMLRAFEVGTPPHGGIGLGFDRQCMLLAGEQSLKEVVAFPMSSSGRTSVMEAPSDVDEILLSELGLQVITNNKK